MCTQGDAYKIQDPLAEPPPKAPPKKFHSKSSILNGSNKLINSTESILKSINKLLI
jgi:hypothetical protein